jgi:predicted kinase
MKKLVVFGGPPCSGKSTVGKMLGWPHLEMDAVRVRVLPESEHTREDRSAAYRAMLMMAEKILEVTDTAIVDGGFGHVEDREDCEAVCARTKAKLYVVEFTVPLGMALMRNAERRAAHPGLDLDDARVMEIIAGYPWTRVGITVDSLHSPEECAEAVREYVEKGEPVEPGSFGAAQGLV